VSTATAALELPRRRAASVLLDRINLKLLVLAGVLLALPATFISANRDPDFWWHLRDGQWIVAHLAVPAGDIYTYTVAGRPWIDHEYLGEALMWLGYQAGGTLLLGLAFGAVTWFGFVLLFRAGGGRSQPYLIAGAGLALGALVGLPIWSARLQMVTFFFACLELLWLRSFLAGRSRWIYALPLVMVVWANLHGGWAVAFVFLGAVLAAEAAGWALKPADPAHRRRLLVLALVTVGSLLAVGATPNGVSLYAYPLQTIASSAQQNSIIEWLSPNFHDPRMRAFELMVMLLVAGFALRRPSLPDLLLSLAALALALQATRNLVLFVAVCTPILVITWSEIWRRERPGLRWRLPEVPRSAFVSTMVVFALVGTAGGAAQHVADGLRQQPALTAFDFPVDASNWIAAHPDEVGTRMFNQYAWGGYLAYRFYPRPDRRVFIFGEAELMGDPLLYDYQRVQDITPQWQAVLHRHRVDTVLFNAGTPLDVLLGSRSDWRQVYRDPVAVIYVKK